MKFRIAHVLLIVALLMPGARAAVPDQMDAAVIAAVLRFIDALEAGDAQALEQSIAVFVESPAQEQARKTFVEMAVAQKSLEKTALAKFGEEGKRFRCGFDLIASAADRKMIAVAKVHWDDTHMARIEIPGEVTQMALRRNQEGRWQVMLDHIEMAEDEPEHPVYPPLPYLQPGQIRQAQLTAIRDQKTRAMIESFKQTQKRIDNGELTTAAAAQTELLAKLTAAALDAAKAKAALPPLRMKDRPN
jgi:hypothetical protein